MYGWSVLGRFWQWASSNGLKILAVVFAIGAVVDALLGHRTSAIVSAVLAAAVFMRDRARQSG